MFLKKFCCCLDLVEGVAIWGVISTALSFLNVFNKVFNVWNFQGIFARPEHFTIEINVDQAFLYVIFAIEVITPILLIYGAFKRDHRFMLPYLGFASLCILITWIQTISLLVQRPRELFFIGCVILLHYLWWCVRSAQKKLQNDKKTAEIPMATKYPPAILPNGCGATVPSFPGTPNGPIGPIGPIGSTAPQYMPKDSHHPHNCSSNQFFTWFS